MHDQATTRAEDQLVVVNKRGAGEWRGNLRDQALRNALRKRTSGVPSYSVPEAAALLSISAEYLYRLIKTAGFPAVRMRAGGTQGRYVVPAKAVEQLLDEVAAAGGCVEVSEWSKRWRAEQDAVQRWGGNQRAAAVQRPAALAQAGRVVGGVNGVGHV